MTAGRSGPRSWASRRRTCPAPRSNPGTRSRTCRAFLSRFGLFERGHLHPAVLPLVEHEPNGSRAKLVTELARREASNGPSHAGHRICLSEDVHETRSRPLSRQCIARHLHGLVALGSFVSMASAGLLWT